MLLAWVNGAFGAGKTTTAKALIERCAGLRLFDPEWVGYLLTSHLKDETISDFQDLAGWRRLVPTVAAELAAHAGETLVAAQTVLSERYWRELRAGLEDHGFEVLHVVLDADAPTLTARIETDTDEPDARQWRLDHITQFVAARAWLTSSADLVVDTTRLTAEQVAAEIAATLAVRLAATESAQ